MPEQKEQAVDEHKWLTNPYAMCECLMQDEWHASPELFPVCTYFEDDGADLDICIACGHGEACHLKGHEPATQGEEG